MKIINLFRRVTLSKEITLMFVFKLAVLTLIWWFCFAQPASHLHLTTIDLKQRILA